MSKSSFSTSRRSFLKGTALAGGALVASSMLAACSSGGGAAEGGEAEAAEGAESAGANGMSQTMAEYYAANPLVAADAQWEEIYRFEPGDSAMIEGMNFTEDGTLWFIDIGMGRIMKLDMETRELEKLVDHGMLTDEIPMMPNGARIIDEDTLLIADRNSGLCTFTISTKEYKPLEVTFDLDNARWGRAVADEKQGWDILNDLVLAGNNTCYVTDPGLSDYLAPTGRVWYVDYSGYKEGKATAQVWARGYKYPNGITISPDGSFLYVAEFNTNSIINTPTWQYVQGKVLDTPYVVAQLSGGHGPDGVITDAAGNIYCAHLHAKEIAVVDSQGWPVQNIRLPEAANTDPSNLAIHGGYLYCCEFADGVIWRIPVNAEPSPFE